LHDIDAIAIAWNPAINMNMFKKGFSHVHRWFPEILYTLPNHMMRMARPDNHEYIHQEIIFDASKKLNIYYVQHHMSHAALSYYLSGYTKSAILSVDGFGERTCTQWFNAVENRITGLQEQWFPHSIGSFYETMTEFLGYTPDSDEWKVMGMAAYGDPSHYEKALNKLIAILPDGRYELDLAYFNHYNFDQPSLFSPKMCALLGAPRKEDSPLEQKHYDLAASAQQLFEKLFFHCLNHLHVLTGETHLCLCGGSVMNCLANGKVSSNTPFRHVFIPYAPDDSGNAIGCALYLYHDILGNNRPEQQDRTSFLGPSWSDDQIKDSLDKYGIPYRHSDEFIGETAALIASGSVVAWYQGRMEFGQRALGNRSILADPRRADMKDIINMKVKYRELFRPFAPSILKESVSDYFEIPDDESVPYMEKVYTIKKSKCSIIPAAVHEDGTGRLQVVDKGDNPLFHELIRTFGEQTGVPVLINTSFNIKGEPIVNSPEDAIRTFFTSGLDVLVMGHYIIEKRSAACH
jgi:carbamoyltransferase